MNDPYQPNSSDSVEENAAKAERSASSHSLEPGWYRRASGQRVYWDGTEWLVPDGDNSPKQSPALHDDEAVAPSPPDEGADTSVPTAPNRTESHRRDKIIKRGASEFEWVCSCGARGAADSITAAQESFRRHAGLPVAAESTDNSSNEGSSPSGGTGSRADRSAVPERSVSKGGCGGCLLTAIVLVLIIGAIGSACGVRPPGGSGSGSYSDDAWNRCKDILYGSDYPSDRLTSQERQSVTDCAVAASK